MSERDGNDQLAELRQRYASQLPGRLEEVRSAWEIVRQRPQTESLRTLHRLVHNLNGSAACYGFVELGERALAAEMHLRAMLDGTAPMNDLGWLGELLRSLRDTMPSASG